MSEFYRTDPDDPAAPVRLEEYRGIRPGDRVAYENPAYRRPDGTFHTLGLPAEMTVTAIYRFASLRGEPEFVPAILDGGEYETSADNLRRIEGKP